MESGIDNAVGGYTASELDARSGAFVNDTAPGVDGSVLAMNTVPASEEESSRSYLLAEGLRGRGRSIVLAAVGGGLLALAAFFGKRYYSPRPRFPGLTIRSRRRRGLFAW